MNARPFNLCHCVQHLRKLTSRFFWSSRNERKPLSQQKCVLRKCCRVSQKQWMLELSNLCHCVQHLWKPTSRAFWNSRNKRKQLSKQKCVLRKCCRVSQKWWMLEQYASHLCSGNGGRSFGQSRFICQVLCTHIHGISVLIPGGISGDLGMKENHFLSKNVFWENAVGDLRNGEC